MSVPETAGASSSACSLTVSSGFKVRVITQAGAELSSGQVTASYVGAPHDWKRVAIALPAGVTAADLARVRFDAYDSDGIYLTAIGDVFVPQPAGANGATLAYARRGELALTQYVDDNYSGCAAGVTPGPGGATYTCTGSFVDVALTR
mgnify:FL=1